MAARKKTIAGELVTRIGEEHSGFHLLGDCDFNNKNIYGPLNIVNNNGNVIGIINDNGLTLKDTAGNVTVQIDRQTGHLKIKGRMLKIT